MIPYSAVVNPGDDIVPYLNVQRSHNFSTCLRFDDDAMFDTTVLDLTQTYGHISHFDPDWFYDDPKPMVSPWCHVGDHNAIVAHSADEATGHVHW